MATFNLPSESGLNFTEGPFTLFVYVAQEVPIVIPSILLAFFMIVFLTGSQLQRKLEGKSVYPQWGAIAGYLTSTLAMIMMLVEGLIALYTVGITIGITLLLTIWFFMSKD